MSLTSCRAPKCGSMGEVRPHRSSSAAVPREQTVRELRYRSESNILRLRRLIKWFKMGLVCHFTFSHFFCSIFLSTEFFICVSDHSSPSFSYNGYFFPYLFPPSLVFPHLWLPAPLTNSALLLNFTCQCPSTGVLWSVSSLVHTLSSPPPLLPPQWNHSSDAHTSPLSLLPSIFPPPPPFFFPQICIGLPPFRDCHL